MESDPRTSDSVRVPAEWVENIPNSAPIANPPESQECDGTRYVLMTAAHNEEANIEKTIESVLSQTRLPSKWVIVSDNSDDMTDKIIEAYEKTYPWIKYGRVTRRPGRSFASKIIALQLAYRLLDGVRFDFIGNIDADVTVPNTYFAQLVDRLGANRRLGIGGGFVY